jgi:DNA-binding GntR family transcriptional regulator
MVGRALGSIGKQQEQADGISNQGRAGSRASRRRHYFGSVFYEFAGMPQTLHFAQVLWARYPFDVINRVEGRVRRAAAEHDELLSYLILGDAAGAMFSMRRHIETGWMAFQSVADHSAASAEISLSNILEAARQ